MYHSIFVIEEKALNVDFSAARKVIMPITAGTETFQEIGEELRGDGSMVMITKMCR